jgi:hypothetical protein
MRRAARALAIALCQVRRQAVLEKLAMLLP